MSLIARIRRRLERSPGPQAGEVVDVHALRRRVLPELVSDGATCRTLGDCGSMRFPAYLQSLLPLGCRLRVWGYRTDIKRAAETRDLDVFSTSVEGYG